ncbi:hypothetical protein ACSQ67_018586 [Phaseolus vulgaris]
MALSTETEALALMLHHILTDSETDVAQCFKEETIEKVMQELYKEIMASPPSSTPTLFSSDASLVVQVHPQDESVEIEVTHDQKTCNGDQGQLLDITH